MKKYQVALLILLLVLADQLLKIYIKTSFPLHGDKIIFKDWFQLYFVENPGMAYGIAWGGSFGKILLTVIRILAVIFGTWFIAKLIKEHYTKGLLICASLIYAGALGNLIDSCFYGLIFDKGMVYNTALQTYEGYAGIAHFSKHGYSSFLHGNVVDMLYFPIIKGTFPSWFPIWGGEQFEFFRPIFNIADACITVGVLVLILFQKKLVRKTGDDSTTENTNSSAASTNQSAVSTEGE